MVWTTIRPCGADLTVDGGGLVVAVYLGRFPKGAARLLEVIDGSAIKSRNQERLRAYNRYVCSILDPAWASARQ